MAERNDDVLEIDSPQWAGRDRLRRLLITVAKEENSRYTAEECGLLAGFLDDRASAPGGTGLRWPRWSMGWPG
jgi:hypothetical protein